MSLFAFFALCLCIASTNGIGNEHFVTNDEKYVLVKSENPITWYDSQQYCISTFGTELASIHSSTDHETLRSAADTNMYGSNIWIGFTDATEETKWEWIDGTTVDYINWDLGQPTNNNYNEDCALLYWAAFTTDGWHDHSCDFEADGFVCNYDTCDRTEAMEECLTRGCDCWLTSNNVKYQEWLNDCIDTICSYNKICQEYSCTIEECVDGNCDLKTEYTNVCENSCKNNCGMVIREYGLISVRAGQTTNVYEFNDMLPFLSDVYSYIIIEFDWKVTYYDSTTIDKRHGGFWFGSGSRLVHSSIQTVTSIDYAEGTIYGFRFAGLTSSPGDVIYNGNGFTFDYSAANLNPEGRWKIVIDKSDLSGEFSLNDVVIYNGFTVNYPMNVVPTLGFGAWTTTSIQVSNIKVTYDII